MCYLAGGGLKGVWKGVCVLPCWRWVEGCIHRRVYVCYLAGGGYKGVWKGVCYLAGGG